MKVDQIVEKFRLKDDCLVGGKIGPKMEDDCIQRFVDGDPSGHGKYLSWMFYQAGGGKGKLERSKIQWTVGEHGEPPLRDMVKFHWMKARLGGFKDDITGEVYKPVTKEEAERLWEAEEPHLQDDYVYGDRDHRAEGGFGFFRTWGESAGAYQYIVDLVQRFHKNRQALREKGAHLDLTLGHYPAVTDLAVVLKEVIAAELKQKLDHDVVYDNKWLQVVCPYTIGSSLRYGIKKWCTANESEMLRALAGENKNRWAEHAEVSALYYFRFRNTVGDSHSVAVQVMHDTLGMPLLVTDDLCPNGALTEQAEAKMAMWKVTGAKYWDAEDKSHSLEDFLRGMTNNNAVNLEHLASFKEALTEVAKHYRHFDRKRVVLNWCI